METVIEVVDRVKIIDWPLYVSMGLMLFVCHVPFRDLFDDIKRYWRAK